MSDTIELQISPVSNSQKTLAMAREEGVPLMFTLSQLGYWSAKHLGDTGLAAMQQRGLLQVGMVADITVFDANKVAPRSTYEAGEHGLPPIGIFYVIVNGVVVVDDQKVLDVRPGQSVRFPVQKQGRFKPVESNGWVRQVQPD